LILLQVDCLVVPSWPPLTRILENPYTRFAYCLSGRSFLNTDLFAAELSQVVAPTSGIYVAPVWRRCVAYFADSVFLGLVGAGIGKVFYDRLLDLGTWGVLIGFFIGSLYFASLDCSIGNGQTLGKRLLKVRLVNVNGKAISFEKALVRYTIFAVPILAYGLKFPESRTSWVVTALVFVIVYWIGGSTLYLVVLERQNRQGIHDLATGSYVVYADHEGPVEPKPVVQLLRLILGSLLLALTVCAAMLKDWSEKQPTVLEFNRDARPIESMDGVQRAYLKDRLRHGSSGDAKKVLYVDVVRKTKPLSEEAFAYDLATALLNADRSLKTYDLVNVRLFYGYDIGIASHWEHREFEQSPSAWRNR
jgi:uncharacterized RDD family membrane protein YckC